jgi:hypothetical protein
MSPDRTRDAVRLVWPGYKSGFAQALRLGERRATHARNPQRDGVRVLKRRALVRAVAHTLRPLNAAALVATGGAFAILASAALILPVTGLLLTGLLIERLTVAPATRRAPRIVGRLAQDSGAAATAPATWKRAARIVSGRPEFQLSGLPPHRPRTRVSERRPGPYVEEEE